MVSAAGGAEGRRPLSGAGRRHRLRRAAAAGAGDAGAYRRLRHLCARRQQHGLYRRLPADPRQRPHRFPGRRRRRRCSARCASRFSRCRTSACSIPAHDYRGLTVTSVAEERRYNPRLGGDIAVGDFTGYMKNLRLAHPKLLDVAVPANLRCGRPETEDGSRRRPELGAAALQLCRGVGDRPARARGASAAAVQILDVREPDEFTGPLGHIEGAVLIPLGELAGAGRASWRATGRSSRCAAPAAARRRRPRSCSRPGSARSPISTAGCCAGAPRATRSRAAAPDRPQPSSDRSPWSIADEDAAAAR